jgi:phosphatidylglycerol---prolipoprotein diacylglyceryl transferase
VTTTVLAYIPSPSQGVWHIGPVPLRAYALFIIVGIVAALVLGDRRWEARGGERGVIYDIALWAVPFGLIGGRLYHVITDWRTYFGEDGAGLAGAVRIWDGGLGIWGAVALGGVGAWIGCRQHGIPLPAFGDAIAPGIVLAQAIGRLGNYFNQELYGRPTTLPWGLEIYERRDAAGALDTLNGVSTGQLIEVVHPTFLYELLWNLLIFAALIWLDRRFKIGHGRLFAAYVAGYCVGRFCIELMRSDVATHIAGIRVNSFTSTFVFIGAVVYIMVAPKGREDPASLAGKPEGDEDKEDAVEAFAKELTAVAATTGVVAAAKAAVEDEDAEAAAEKSDAEEPEEHLDAEALHADVAEVPEPDVSEEAEELGADVAGVPADSIAEAEEFAAEGEEEAEEPEAGLGVVEGDEAVEAVDAAPEVHDAAVDAAVEAEVLADEVGAEADVEEPEAEEPQAEAKPETEDVEAAEPQAGLGVVEGEEAAEAQEAAPEVHDAAVEAADDAEAVADEVAAEDEEPSSEAAAEAEELAEDVADAPSEDIAEAEAFAAAGEEADDEESDDSEPDEPETEAAEAAVEDALREPSEVEAAEEAEAVDAEADVAADDEPKTGVLEEAQVEDAAADEPEPVEDPGGRLSRWLRRNR